MNEKIFATLEEILASNQNGEVKNLLITDGNAEFLDDALCALRSWSLKNEMNLVAQDGDIESANMCVHDLWALDHKWARFFRKVAKDYYRKPEDHDNFAPDNAVYNPTGMDQLFHIYLLGWYCAGNDFFNEKEKLYVRAHKDFNKAIDLLSVRFQNCSIDEVVDKLFWDLLHIDNDVKSDYKSFANVLLEAERQFPGVINKIRDKVWLNGEVEGALKGES